MTHPYISGDQQKKPGHGCLFWGGIISAVLLLIVILVVYAGYSYVRMLVNRYTDDKPLNLPTVQLSSNEVYRIHERINTFTNAVFFGKATEPLMLSADEINGLIQSNVHSNSHARFFVSFEEDRVKAQLSVPLAEAGMRMLSGRYFNGSGEFNVSLHDGFLRVNVRSLEVRGRPVPEKFMQSIRRQNFAEGWMEDTNSEATLKTLKEIKVEGGKLIIVPQPPQPATNALPTTNALPATVEGAGSV